MKIQVVVATLFNGKIWENSLIINDRISRQRRGLQYKTYLDINKRKKKKTDRNLINRNLSHQKRPYLLLKHLSLSAFI